MLQAQNTAEKLLDKLNTGNLTMSYNTIKICTLDSNLKWSSEQKLESLTIDQEKMMYLVHESEMCESNIMLVNFDHMLIKEQCILLNLKNDNTAMMLTFASNEDAQDFIKLLSNASKTEIVDSGLSRFDQRTEEASASSYFQFYGCLAQQQNMMQDFIRTSTYQRAVLANLDDFKDKVVLDVGAGSGILSFFAVQAEAKTVYAIEASSMAVHCETLTKSNGYEDRIKVIAEKVENAVLPELVDTIISEPMGCMLLNERMLESFVHARKFLKPGGKMYPTIGDLHFAPFSDEILYAETCAKANFWAQDHFHGINLSALKTQGFLEFFRQPIVDTFHCGILMAHGLKYTIDFSTCAEESFQRIEIPFDFEMKRTCFVHGMAFWFDVAFIGTNSTVWLSTSPSEPLTHWYQVRCQIMHPLFCKIDSHLTGTVIFVANKRQSYDIELTMSCDGKSTTNVLDLKYPFFRYNGQPVQPPPGNQNISPTDAYWSMVRQQPTTSEQHFAVNGNGAIVGVDVNDPQSMAQNAVNAWNAAGASTSSFSESAFSAAGYNHLGGPGYVGTVYDSSLMFYPEHSEWKKRHPDQAVLFFTSSTF
ncbi:Histone-arginine methyltransferase CARM1 [Trichinella murrelli]|uniref:type I protein arginine methyltransferase n=1 Tax=Trichinella murrelli TaxID=144512 RepID=A0A0V0UDY7_9BILA|nr:Histone-arginine methyltransferase CARM1 [Trichinella murrelli]